MQELLKEPKLREMFNKAYGRDIAEGDEYVLTMWKQVLPQLQLSLKTLGLGRLPKVSDTELLWIEQIITDKIPELRRQAAPSEKSFAHQLASLFRES